MRGVLIASFMVVCSSLIVLLCYVYFTVEVGGLSLCVGRCCSL